MNNCNAVSTMVFFIAVVPIITIANDSVSQFEQEMSIVLSDKRLYEEFKYEKKLDLGIRRVRVPFDSPSDSEKRVREARESMCPPPASVTPLKIFINAPGRRWQDEEGKENFDRYGLIEFRFSCLTLEKK